MGEAEVTLEVGREALLHKKAVPYRRDVLLAMALASCGLASSALAQEQVPLLLAVMRRTSDLKSWVKQMWSLVIMVPLLLPLHLLLFLNILLAMVLASCRLASSAPRPGRCKKAWGTKTGSSDNPVVASAQVAAGHATLTEAELLGDSANHNAPSPAPQLQGSAMLKAFEHILVLVTWPESGSAALTLISRCAGCIRPCQADGGPAAAEGCGGPTPGLCPGQGDPRCPARPPGPGCAGPAQGELTGTLPEMPCSTNCPGIGCVAAPDVDLARLAVALAKKTHHAQIDPKP